MLISACIADPFAEWLRIRSSGEDAFTVPRIEAQAAGCIEPCSTLKQKRISVNAGDGCPLCVGHLPCNDYFP
jgi:hypothetical protein